jgi:hypothetical protein
MRMSQDMFSLLQISGLENEDLAARCVRSFVRAFGRYEYAKGVLGCRYIFTGFVMQLCTCARVSRHMRGSGSLQGPSRSDGKNTICPPSLRGYERLPVVRPDFLSGRHDRIALAASCFSFARLAAQLAIVDLRRAATGSSSRIVGPALTVGSFLCYPW